MDEPKFKTGQRVVGMVGYRVDQPCLFTVVRYEYRSRVVHLIDDKNREWIITDNHLITA